MVNVKMSSVSEVLKACEALCAHSKSEVVFSTKTMSLGDFSKKTAKISQPGQWGGFCILSPG